jgi:amphiphysin
MNSMQRQFGKLTHKGAGDDAKVSVLLQDFDEADKMLTKVSFLFESALERS